QPETARLRFLGRADLVVPASAPGRLSAVPGSESSLRCDRCCLSALRTGRTARTDCHIPFRLVPRADNPTAPDSLSGLAVYPKAARERRRPPMKPPPASSELQNSNQIPLLELCSEPSLPTRRIRLCRSQQSAQG